MSLTHIIVVALVQGITEFLPISSSAHLILVPGVTGWCDQGLLIDIAVHVGTLIAVMLYFWRDCLRMARGGLLMFVGRFGPDTKLLLYIVLATIPTVGAGYLIKTHLGTDLRSLAVIGWATLGFGVLLWISDKWGLRVNRVEHMTWGSALFIGLFQVLALIPGTSRSGITMTAARLLGFERADAARFSMLMSIPIIIAAGTLAGLDLAQAGNTRLTGDALVAGAIACAAALVAIAALMGWLKRATFTPFVIYRVLLGLALLGAVYGLGLDEGALSACPA